MLLEKDGLEGLVVAATVAVAEEDSDRLEAGGGGAGAAHTSRHHNTHSPYMRLYKIIRYTFIGC